MKTNNKNFAEFMNNEPYWYIKRFDRRYREFKGITIEDWQMMKAKHYCRLGRRDYDMRTKLQRAVDAVKKWSNPENGSYQKIAIWGYTNLYLASPDYQHEDYNKSILLPIKGNERACELLIKLSKKIAKI